MPVFERDQEDWSFFDLNQDALDVEWCRQPRLYFDYAVKVADARRELNEEKAAMDLCDADLDMAIRSDPEKYGLEKVTEPAIKKCIASDTEHQRFQREVNDREHRVGILSAAVAALDHRKRALENLVDLHNANYFSSPVEKRGSQKMSEVATNNNSKRANAKIGRKRSESKDA